VQKLLEQFFSSPTYAVVGVSTNREKYGNIVYRYLRDKNFPVYPINPHLTEVEGNRCFASVSELPDDVKSVVLVVPPSATEQVVRDCKTKSINAVWMQPGAESVAAIEFARQNSIAAIYDACVMVVVSPAKSFSDVNWLLEKLNEYGNE
jgi:predicted CoA-binding protein